MWKIKLKSKHHATSYKRDFRYLNKRTFLLLYKSLLLSQVEYTSRILYLYKIGLINNNKSVQRRATKLIPKLKINHITID